MASVFCRAECAVSLAWFLASNEGAASDHYRSAVKQTRSIAARGVSISANMTATLGVLA